MTFQFGSELTFTGPALPESFIQHELEHALGKALPSAKDAEAGSIRVRNAAINPLLKALGYTEIIATENVDCH